MTGLFFAEASDSHHSSTPHSSSIAFAVRETCNVSAQLGLNVVLQIEQKAKPHSPISDCTANHRFDSLIEEIGRHSDVRAFSLLFVYYRPILQRHFQRQFASNMEAEDLTQDVLLTVWEKAPQFDSSRGSANAWIFAIARNRWIDKNRRRNLREALTRDPAYQAVSENSEAVPAIWSAGKLRDVVNLLPQAQATVVEASYFSEKSHRQISAETGIPVGTVKSRIRLAIRRLRGQLKNYDDQPKAKLPAHRILA